MTDDLEAQADVELDGWVVVLADEQDGAPGQGQDSLHELAGDASSLRRVPNANTKNVHKVLVYPN